MASRGRRSATGCRLSARSHRAAATSVEEASFVSTVWPPLGFLLPQSFTSGSGWDSDPGILVSLGVAQSSGSGESSPRTSLCRAALLRERIGGTKSHFQAQGAVSQVRRIGHMSTRRPWKFSCRADDCHLRSTGCYETRILAHLCLQARISIVPVLVRSEYYRLLDGAVR